VIHTGKQNFSLDHWELAKVQILNADKNNDGIAGWMTRKELEFLGEAASRMQSVIEIGSWKGRSTKELLDGGATVTAVDHWKGTSADGDSTDFIAQQEDVYAEFMKNVGHYPNLKVMKMCSLEAAKSLNGDRFDMGFIDATHDYENMKADLEAWLPKVKKLICGHDYSPGWPGVVRAVNEKFGADKIKTCGSIWYVELEECNEKAPGV
jgi:hypothetical protein